MTIFAGDASGTAKVKPLPLAALSLRIDAPHLARTIRKVRT